MQKHNRKRQSSKQRKAAPRSYVIGMDLGDKTSRYCVLEEDKISKEGSVATGKEGLEKVFGSLSASLVAIEVGTHSAWVERKLRELGHEVIVANPRQLRLITHSSNKTDKMDARTLARLARADRELLRPVRHRGEEAQLDLMRIRVRGQLVEARTGLINTARGLAKSMGERLPSCDANAWSQERLRGIATAVAEVLRPLVEQIEQLSGRIKEADEELEQIARTKYPETEGLRQVPGVGLLIALTYVLTIDDPQRFRKSRDVGCFTGLRPKRSQSGERDPQLGITKEGDVYLRKLLVQGAHRMLSRQSPDTDLKRFGERLSMGGKNKKARKRAIVAVARKLSICCTGCG